jgi:hypothetical protein
MLGIKLLGKKVLPLAYTNLTLAIQAKGGHLHRQRANFSGDNRREKKTGRVTPYAIKKKMRRRGRKRCFDYAFS